MKWGLNLSFAVKRWMEPEGLAEMVKRDFGVGHVQLTWDLINPWWPQEKRAALAKKFKDAFEKEGVEIDSTFSGLAAYSYGQLLAPDVLERESAFLFFERAIDMTRELGAKVMGTAVGAMSYHDARDASAREERYQGLLGYLRELAAYGKGKGLKEIHVEATPVYAEIPYSPEISVKMMEELEGTDIPVRLLIDWGHALYKPLLKEKADIGYWFQACAPYIGAVHLQQTDGEWDRHWDFTKEGIVTPDLIKRATSDAGLDDIMQYLEVCTATEEDDDSVYDKMKRTVDFLHRELD